MLSPFLRQPTLFPNGDIIPIRGGVASGCDGVRCSASLARCYSEVRGSCLPSMSSRSDWTEMMFRVPILVARILPVFISVQTVRSDRSSISAARLTETPMRSTSPCCFSAFDGMVMCESSPLGIV